MIRFRFASIASALLLAAHFTPNAAAAPEASTWQRIQPAPVTIDGHRYEPTCSQAEGSDPTFAFWYRQGTAEGLVVYFDGGGACWDDASCAAPRFARAPQDPRAIYKSELIPADEVSRMRGIFEINEARNPLRDWSMVFIPYCTGDVHSGSNTARYRDPQTGKSFTIQHRGWDNAQVVIHWMRNHVAQPGRLLVSGSSAGAYGAATHYATLRDLYPRSRAVFLGDAGQGVTTPGFVAYRNSNWNYQLPTKIFGQKPRLTDDEDLVARLAEHFPNDRFAQYTTAYDANQRGFFAMMGGQKSCDAWTSQMSRELERRERVGNFRAYLARGETHTILRSPLFYTESSAGTPFAEWVAALFAEQSPSNAACTDCLSPPASCGS